LCYDDTMILQADFEQIVAEKDARITELEALVKYYVEQFGLLQQRHFGASSEKNLIADQIGIFDDAETVTSDRDESESVIEEISYQRKKPARRMKDDFSSLEVEVVEHLLPDESCDCPQCGGTLHVMGHDTRHEVDIIPAKAKLVEHKRAVYACRNCEKHGERVPIVKAMMPEPVIKGSVASPSAVAHIMTQKYVMYAPLYRQEADWKRQGLHLSRQTMSNWVIRCAEDWLRPLYDRMRDTLVKSHVLHADESGLQVLREPGKPASSNSYMWLYRTSGDTEKHIILFDYQPSRAGIHPKKFLSGFKGLLHVDAYGGYNGLPQDIIRVGCWVHCRRYFTDALKLLPEKDRNGSLEDDAIKKIAFMFHLEDKWEDP